MGNAASDPPISVRSWVMLTFLFCAACLSFADRLILAVLVEPIKADLQLSDTQISILQGIAFVLIYSFAGIFFGRLVDRVPRLRLAAGGVMVWSAAAMSCGLASRFWQLAIGRAGVGVGEAILSPAAFSLIADAFPKRKLGLATGVYAFGMLFGTGMSFLLGARIYTWAVGNGDAYLPWIGLLKPWQQTFAIVGAPGILLGLAMWFVPEPGRTADRGAPGSDWADLGRYFRANWRWIAPHHTAAGLGVAVGSGTSYWIVSLLSRAHRWSILDAATAAGTATIVGSGLGLLGGGAVSDFVSRRGSHLRMTMCGTALIIAAVACVVFPLTGSTVVAVILWGAALASSTMLIGVAGASLQELTPGSMRGSVTGIYFLVVNLVAVFAGPTAVAVVADSFFARGDGIRFALATTMPVCGIIGAASAFFAARVQRLQRRDTLPGLSAEVRIPDDA